MSDLASVAITGVDEKNTGYYPVPGKGKQRMAMSTALPGLGTDPQSFGGVSNDDMQGTGEEVASFVRTLNSVADLKAGTWTIKDGYEGLLSPNYKAALSVLGKLVAINRAAERFELAPDSAEMGDRAAFYEMDSLKQQFKTEDIPTIAMHIAAVDRKVRQDEFNKKIIARFTKKVMT